MSAKTLFPYYGVPSMDIRINHTYNHSTMGLVKVIGAYVCQETWRRMVQVRVRVVGSTRGFHEVPVTELRDRVSFRF